MVGATVSESEVASLREASRRVVRELGMLGGTFADTGMSPAECHTMVELGRGGHPTAGELAERLTLDKSTMSRVVAKLRRDGLLIAEPCSVDRRKRYLRLTSKGRSRLARLNTAADAQVNDAMALLSSGERQQVLDGMERYARGLSLARRQRGLTLRPIKPADNGAVARLILAVMGEFGVVGQGYASEDPEMADMHAAYGQPGHAFYVVTRGRKVVGVGGLGPLKEGPQDVCELRKMYFLPDVRGLGMGRRMLEHCIRAARELGYRRMYLETVTEMTRAQSLYRRFGFQELSGPMGNTGHCGCGVWFVMDLDREASP